MDGIARLSSNSVSSGAAALEGGQAPDELARLMLENHAIVASLGGSGDAIDALIASCLHLNQAPAPPNSRELVWAGLSSHSPTHPADLQKRAHLTMRI